MIDEKLMTPEECASCALRSLYRRYGYLPFRMSRFEEYDFYARNKDFLVSDRMITFTDGRSRLMALKPDVTLSIIKSGSDTPGCKQKLCYSENVYRSAGETGQFREIMQTGLECMGDLDAYDRFEVIRLAAKSLELLGGDWVLNLSHLGLLDALLKDLRIGSGLSSDVLRCIAGRNLHELSGFCREAGLEEQSVDALCVLARIHAPLSEAVAMLRQYCRSENARAALRELEELCGALACAPVAGKVFFDLSVVNNRKYYNGLVFQGFLEGAPENVLAGGQYDRLMARMGRNSSGLGFAVYLDRLPPQTEAEEADVDLLLLYDDPRKAAAEVSRLADAGMRVCAQREMPPKLRYRELLDLRGGGEHA